MLALALLARAARALDVPPPPAQWYNDSAGLLNSQQAQELNDKLRSFEQQSGAQFIIYVFPSLGGEAVEDFTIRCAEKWKVGNKKYDNGLILFVFVQEKKVRIEVGYGLEATVTDAYSSRVIREQIAPYFQKADYAGGLNAAADALIAKIRGGEAAVPPVQQTGGGSSGVSGIDPFFLIVIVVIFFLFILPMLRGGRRRGGCGGCFWPMLFFPGGGTTFGGRGGGFGGGGFGGFGGGGGFSGGGGGFGGGGATGGW
ncbi:MAG: TPM domain-containing protein [Thermoanaerobaculia bacterium]